MQTQVTSIGTFVGGLNTEQPQLSDQIQYTTDELNCQLLPDGTRARRYGITREENSVGIPASYTETEEDNPFWSVESAEEFNTLTATKMFKFTMVVDTYDPDSYPAIWTEPDRNLFITDGESEDARFQFEVDSNKQPLLCFYDKTGAFYQTIRYWNYINVKADGTSVPIVGRELTFEIHLSDTNEYTTKIYDEDGVAYNYSDVIVNADEYFFDNFLNIVNTEGAYHTSNDDVWFSWHIKDIKFEEDGEAVLEPVIVTDGVGYFKEYNPLNEVTTEEIRNSNLQKEYKINLTSAGIYTVTMCGAGCFDGETGWSGGQGYQPVRGSAGAGITFSTYLEPGEYIVRVGYSEPFAIAEDLNRAPWRDYPAKFMKNGGSTEFYKKDVIDIKAKGGVFPEGYPYNQYYIHGSYGGGWGYQGVFGVPGYGAFSYSGTLELTKTPTIFSIIGRTVDAQEEYKNSFLSGDTTGQGAAGKNGYFKITKGGSGQGTIIVDNGISSAYYWANFDKKGSDCIVLQQGSVLKFFKAERPYDSDLITSIETAEQIEFPDYFTRYNFSSGEGFLLCVSEYAKPFYITLDADNKAAVLNPITLQIRDLHGVDDGLTTDQEPTTLSDKHKYNLFNQGWDTTKINSYYSSQSKYPSNALIWWYGKDANGDFQAVNLTKMYFGTTPAPRGHYVLNYFNQDRSDVSGIAGIEAVTKDRYVIDSAFFAGRFFYLANSTVLFSQILKEDVRGIGKCYQEADPTSQTISDIIATDGGEIIFQELGYGKAITKFPLGILTFGSKGVYAITSTSVNTFSATQYLTQFVTHAGAISGGSVVSAEDTVWYWSPQGIYQITVDQISGTSAVASSVSAGSIQTWYNDLPNFSKENCIGAYDYTNRRIVWLYPTHEDDLENRDGVLAYYVDFKAFLPSKISEGGKAITVFETVLPSYIVPTIDLYADEDEVVAGDTEVTVKNFGSEYGRNFSVCYLGYIDSYDSLFFCDFASREFLDWNVSTYNSYLNSFPITFGSTWQKKYTPVIQCYFLRTEEDELTNGTYLAPSSCYVRAKWKWSETQESNRWDLTQQGYIRLPRFMEFRYVNGKIRVHGSGPAMQLRLESKDDNDFKLSGINLLIRTV